MNSRVPSVRGRPPLNSRDVSGKGAGSVRIDGKSDLSFGMPDDGSSRKFGCTSRAASGCPNAPPCVCSEFGIESDGVSVKPGLVSSVPISSVKGSIESEPFDDVASRAAPDSGVNSLASLTGRGVGTRSSENGWATELAVFGSASTSSFRRFCPRLAF